MVSIYIYDIYVYINYIYIPKIDGDRKTTNKTEGGSPPCTKLESNWVEVVVAFFLVVDIAKYAGDPLRTFSLRFTWPFKQFNLQFISGTAKNIKQGVPSHLVKEGPVTNQESGGGRASPASMRRSSRSMIKAMSRATVLSGASWWSQGTERSFQRSTVGSAVASPSSSSHRNAACLSESRTGAFWWSGHPPRSIELETGRSTQAWKG